MDFILNSPFLLFIASCLVIILVARLLNPGKNGGYNLPRGPMGIFPLGNFLQMAKDPHLKLSKWGKQYGKLCTIYFGPRPALLISDPSLMKELLGTMSATGKFKTDTTLLISRGPYGILNTEGKDWQEQRQFCMRSLKEFGFGKKSIESLILSGVNEACDWIEKTSELKCGKSLRVDKLLMQSTVNVLSTVVIGERVPLGDSDIGTLLETFTDCMQYTMKSGLGFFPWLKYIAPELSGFTAFDKATKDFHTFMRNKFADHKSTFVKGARRDLMDSYIEHLQEIQKTDKAEGSTGGSFSGDVALKNTISSLTEVFISAGEATSVSIHWALVYLSVNQSVQKDLQREIDEVVGNDRDPTVSDRARMPFSEAVVMETLRLSSVVPLGVIHELLEDMPFHDYSLPKGLILVPNMYHIHHDPEVWGDPETFRPGRFLSENQTDLKEYLVPFQAGKRSCLAEPLAKDVLFLFIVKIFQRFQISPDPNIPIEKYLAPDFGILLKAKPLGLLIKAR